MPGLTVKISILIFRNIFFIHKIHIFHVCTSVFVKYSKRKHTTSQTSKFSNTSVRFRNQRSDVVNLITYLNFAENTFKQNDELLNSPNMETDSPAQREMIQISPPCTVPSSPAASPVVQIISSLSLFNINATNDPNWQATRPTIRERNAAMFNNELMSDVHFIVGSNGELKSNSGRKSRSIDCKSIHLLIGNTERIPAHKYILATGSSVFYTMFYGGLPEIKDDIEVLDVEPCAFLTLLRYLIRTAVSFANFNAIVNFDFDLQVSILRRNPTRGRYSLGNFIRGQKIPSTSSSSSLRQLPRNEPEREKRLPVAEPI